MYPDLSPYLFRFLQTRCSILLHEMGHIAMLRYRTGSRDSVPQKVVIWYGICFLKCIQCFMCCHILYQAVRRSSLDHERCVSESGQYGFGGSSWADYPSAAGPAVAATTAARRLAHTP